MSYKINVYTGLDWYNILDHENLENSQGHSDLYHVSAQQFSWLDQDISENSSPSFYNTNMSGDISIWNNDINFITESDVTLNVFTQSVPSSTWNINHGFGTKYVISQTFLNDDTLIQPTKVELLDDNNLSLSFDQPISGYTLYSKVSGTVPSSNPAADHGSLTGLLSDDHTQYILVDGTRGFTGVVSGITPTASNHFATKSYVDNKTWVSDDIVDIEATISNNDDVSNNSNHRTSNGSDHTFIDQDVTVGSAPQFSNVNMYGAISAWTNDSGYITLSSVTYENLDNNGDIGTGSDQVAQGNHNHINMFFTTSVSGSIDISSGWTDLTFDNDIVNDSYYTFIDDKEVKVLKTGLYKIKYDITTYVTNYIDDSDTKTKIQRYNSGSYSDIDGSFKGHMNGSSSDGFGSSFKEMITLLNENDKIKIQSKRENGSSTIETYPNSCNFLIEFLR